MGATYEVTTGSMKYKDTLFRIIFGAEENKEYLLSLYNAVNNSNYTNVEDLEVRTIQDAIFVSRKNDVVFLFDCYMNLFEHQSTINKNMPLRGFIYMANLYDSWVRTSKANVYGSSLVKIPTPRYLVFCNDKDFTKDKEILRLSDAFEVPVQENTYEWIAEVYNINVGRNKELMDKCKALKEYSEFVGLVRQFVTAGYKTKEALIEAVDIASQRNYLDGYFSRLKEEVFSMLLGAIDEELRDQFLREDGIKKGIKKGREEERLKGAKGIIKAYIKLKQSKEFILEQLQEDLEISYEEANKYYEKFSPLFSDSNNNTPKSSTAMSFLNNLDKY